MQRISVAVSTALRSKTGRGVVVDSFEWGVHAQRVLRCKNGIGRHVHRTTSTTARSRAQDVTA